MSENENIDALKNLWNDETQEKPLVNIANLKRSVNRTELFHKLYIGMTVLVTITVMVFAGYRFLNSPEIWQKVLYAFLFPVMIGACLLEWKWRQVRVKKPVVSIRDFTQYQLAEAKFKHLMANGMVCIGPPATILGLVYGAVDNVNAKPFNPEKLPLIIVIAFVVVIIEIVIGMYYRRKFQAEINSVEDMIESLEG